MSSEPTQRRRVRHEIDELLTPVMRHVDHNTPGGVVGSYLCGSAVSSGLRPDSDIDILILTRRSLTDAERSAWVSLLLEESGWKGHADRFPGAANRQPLEVTSLVLDHLRPLAGPLRCDFQFGEWLREDLLAGWVPQPVDDPDIVALLAAAQDSSKVLRGPDLEDLLGPIPPEVLRQALLDLAPRVAYEVIGDERNSLLTLARILVTLETGRMVSKDAAAQAVASELRGNDRELLEYARADYLGHVSDDWADKSPWVSTLARKLAEVAERTTHDESFGSLHDAGFDAVRKPQRLFPNS